MNKTDLPIDEWYQLGSKQGALAREAYIRENADYYTVVFWHGGRNKRVGPYETLEAAQTQAGFAANYLKRPTMIYGVILVPGTADNAYAESLVGVMHPDKE